MAEPSDLVWSLAPHPPEQWHPDVGSLGGGFFHTESGLRAAALTGEPFFAQLRRGADLAGIAAGVRSPCLLSPRSRHVCLPTLPAIVEPRDRHAALDLLVQTLANEGAATVSLDSFDARWQLTKPSVAPVEIWVRREYVVPLETPADVMWQRVGAGHRRHVRRGETEGWQLKLGAGSQARELLAEVQRLASERAATRGDGFRPSQAPFAGDGADPTAASWGSTTFMAYHGLTALAAAMVGWAGGRAFYVLGGSTSAGYRAAASVWLHWRIMCRFAEARFAAYNFGGTPATAESPEDPAHGLYRFKSGFGSRVIPCASARWILSSTHERLHQLGGWLGSAFGF